MFNFIKRLFCRHTFKQCFRSNKVTRVRYLKCTKCNQFRDFEFKMEGE